MTPPQTVFKRLLSGIGWVLYGAGVTFVVLIALLMCIGIGIEIATR